ncbi:MAG: winged helix-turn-helix domain-containing protein [Theionarchaea archaeon]|nr:MAG: hypothetical protein AYK18_00045 [Theionarchaea archaeon DG-70]MBU7009640.1 winged helix-turn-helix domain-containing protein [Theionarchaea archaeon]
MSRLSKKEKLRRYHAIYDQIYQNPRIHIHEISKNLKMARNTISSYLKYMYESGILLGPELRLKYYPGLNEYICLAKFDDPYEAFDQIQMDENVSYASMFFGDWNIMVTSNGPYDLSQISGFESLVFEGERYDITAPRVPSLSNWKTAFQKMKQEINEFDPDSVNDPNYADRRPSHWDKEEWELFYEYKYNFRKKVTPVLRKNLISSDKFYRWIEALPDTANVSTRFFADGMWNYTHFGFFFETNYAEAVTSILSNLPTSIYSIDIDKGLIVTVSIKSDIASAFVGFFDILHEMRTHGIINRFHQAITVLYYFKEE